MGIDQLNLHSVQLGYLKILQMGNTDPNNTKQESKYEVKPQYEDLSKQLIMQHAIINAMKCMRAIKDRIAKLVYQLAIISISLHTHTVYQPGNHRSMIFGARTTHQSTSHNVAFNQVINSICQSGSRCMHISPGTANLKPSLTGHDNSAISPGTANLKPSLTGHDNSAAKLLKHNFKTEENTYPKAYTNRGTLGQDFTESVERTGSSRFLKSTVPVSKLVSIGRETQEKFSATNIIQNNGETRWQSTEENHGEQ
ncbi:hypothetical protein F511_19435 [Dorcoceras hygrometricum]|uniref:Uncharacterized protein n=1 Tax=Dorcoceras hygrometricum TaxID=472368 RepID=A0A2Z7AMA4_9LAMI|nr:hypothetical protein F511_19435 [Dorcoceras hygrometricum]